MQTSQTRARLLRTFLPIPNTILWIPAFAGMTPATKIVPPFDSAQGHSMTGAPRLALGSDAALAWKRYPTLTLRRVGLCGTQSTPILHKMRWRNLIVGWVRLRTRHCWQNYVWRPCNHHRSYYPDTKMHKTNPFPRRSSSYRNDKKGRTKCEKVIYHQNEPICTVCPEKGADEGVCRPRRAHTQKAPAREGQEHMRSNGYSGPPTHRIALGGE